MPDVLTTYPKRGADGLVDGERSRGPLRRWAVAHSRTLEQFYNFFNALLPYVRPIIVALPEPFAERVFRAIEKPAKQAMFGCHMCGTCILSATGMSCPMNCPKNLRNGPCGGVRDGGMCEVKPEMPCVWLDAWQGSAQMRDPSKIKIIQAPLDRRTQDRSTWVALARGSHSKSGFNLVAEPNPQEHPLPPAGALERKLESGVFVVTTEFNPPDTANQDKIKAEATELLELCDSVNVTDGAGANTHIGSFGVCALLAQQGHDPVMQISCRDRNRIAIQGDALAAAALGIKNVLSLTGDGMQQGDQPGAKPVFDLDCTSLLGMLRTMRDEARFDSGRKITDAPRFYLGATSNPTSIPPAVEVGRLAKKIEAGARFIQTQYVFDMEAFLEFHKRFVGEGLSEHCRYLVGVGPLRSAKTARWMRDAVAGVRIPDSYIERLERAADPRAEGIDYCVETIQRLRELPGIAGVHIMAFRQRDALREVIERSGLLDRNRQALIRHS